jgi:hypothetical protein
MVDEAEEDWAKRNGDNAGQDAIAKVELELGKVYCDRYSQ